MMPSADDDMSLREIARTLADFRQEFRTQVLQLLRADVYRAEQAALEVRISGLEKDRDQAEQNAVANRRLALGAMLSAIGTIIVSLILIAAR
jgi:hypothetical protein